jgi:hypothetical protein
MSWIEPLVILSAILLLLAAVTFLALLQAKQQAAVTSFLTTHAERSEQARRQESELLRELILTTLDAVSSNASESQATMAATLAQQHQSTTHLLLKTVESATFGASSTANELTKVVGDLTSLLGTKDPMAYQAVLGAQAATRPSGAPWEPYTSTEVEAQEEAAALQQQQLDVSDVLTKMMNFAGVPNVDTTAPYPTAG